MWETLKQGITGPETALDGCFSPSASVYPVSWSHVEVGGAQALGALWTQLALLLTAL